MREKRVAEQQKFSVKVPKSLDPAEREEVANDIIEAITLRALNENKGFNPATGREFKFAKYSKAYAKFKNTPVNLMLSGDMMKAMTLLQNKNGEITIGFKKSDKENNGKAEGNALGTYGQPSPVAPPRPFLGITKTKLKEILSRITADEDVDDDDDTES